MVVRIGTIIASAIDSRVTDESETKLKWPNDVLLNNEKVDDLCLLSMQWLRAVIRCVAY